MKISCFTCKYGYEDERLGIPMCHHPKRFSEDCVNFNMYEEKEIKEPEKIAPNDLEEASEISFDEAYTLTEDYVDFLAKRLKENQPRPIGPNWFCEYAKKRFIAGAKWQKEQIMKDAVEGVLVDNVDGTQEICLHGNRYGDKVRVIVLPKDD